MFPSSPAAKRVNDLPISWAGSNEELICSFPLLQQIYPKRRQFAPLPSSNYLLNIRKKGSACLFISPQGVVAGRSGVGRAEGGVKEDCLPGAALHSTSWPSPACSGS